MLAPIPPPAREGWSFVTPQQALGCTPKLMTARVARGWFGRAVSRSIAQSIAQLLPAPQSIRVAFERFPASCALMITNDHVFGSARDDPPVLQSARQVLQSPGEGDR